MDTQALKSELSGLRELFSELEKWSINAAQELQDLLDETTESGSPEPTGVKNLLDDHNALINKIMGTK